jgi:hypothetical protein
MLYLRFLLNLRRILLGCHNRLIISILCE